MATTTRASVAVVGSGVAALTCARLLAQKDTNVTLFTSRGKLATQMGPRNQTLPKPGEPFFDYGCQYFTASDEWFIQEVERWAKLGACTPLPPGEVGVLSQESGFVPFPNNEQCWVGNGGMGPMYSKLLQEASREFPGTLEHVSGFPDEARRVIGLDKSADGSWHLETKGGTRQGPFDLVIGGFAQHCLTDPFLLSGGPPAEDMLRCLRSVESNQIIPIQLVLDGGALDLGFTAAHVAGEEALAFVGDNTRKPQQGGELGTPGPQHLTLLSSAGFAEREFNRNSKGYRRSAEREMLSALERVLHIDPGGLSKHRPRINRINHWEDGLPMTTPPASMGCLLDEEALLGWCGDFCVAPSLEGAALSGRAMAEAATARLKRGAPGPEAQRLLPASGPWPRMGQADGAITVDIGAFSHRLGLDPVCTHTNLVPSAADGYDIAARTGAAGAAIAHGNKGATGGKGSGKAKGKSKGRKGVSKGRGPYAGGMYS